MTTLNLQVGASADDGRVWQEIGDTPESFSATSRLIVGTFDTDTGVIYDGWARFTGVSGLSGATINSATFTIEGFNNEVGAPLTQIRADDQAAPAAPTTVTEMENITRTTASITYDDPNLDTDVVDPIAITAVIQELADSYDPSVIQIICDDTRGTDSMNRFQAKTYDQDTAKAPKLDIDYTGVGVTTRRYSLTVVGVG